MASRLFLILILSLSATAAIAAPDVTTMIAAGAEAFQQQKNAESQAIFEAVLAADPNNKAAKNYLLLLAKRQSTGATTIEASLKEVVIPIVNLRDTSPREAVTYVSQQVAKITEGRQALNVVWLVPATTTLSPVTLNLQSVPASEVLRYITAAAGLTLAYDAHAVKVSVPSAN